MKQIQYFGNKNIISEKVKERRIELNISQTELAAKMQVMNVNIDQQMISKIEKNKRQVTDY
ncbi:MAG: helix-turn-helix transcriptional regulator, partial [Candidatus Fimenecus sp.]|nr:helix-turn-helix transcriptional regulator [Candidatus Fimenecus sp.]